LQKAYVQQAPRLSGKETLVDISYTKQGLGVRASPLTVDHYYLPLDEQPKFRVHFIIVKIRCTGLAPWEFEFPFPGSLTSTSPDMMLHEAGSRGAGIAADGGSLLLAPRSFTREDYNTDRAHHWSLFPLRRAHPGPGPHTMLHEAGSGGVGMAADGRSLLPPPR